MARWNTLTDDEMVDRTVFTGAYGFDNCDALGKVWARTFKGFERAMSKAINDSARMHADEHESFGKVRDQIWYVGPFEERVGDLDMEEPARRAEMLDDMRTSASGYVY